MKDRRDPTLSFHTEDSLHVPAVSADQMRELDRIAVEETGPNLYQMMENAGRTLAEFSLQRLGASWREARILVLAGDGGNGGGGICAARHLANRGAHVQLCIAEPHHLAQVSAFQRQLFKNAGGIELDARDVDKQLRPNLVLDALIGYGLRSAPARTVAKLIEWTATTTGSVISLDVPSGLDATSGEAPGNVVKPSATITLALPKTGLRPQITGDLFLADIGIPLWVYQRVVPEYASPFGNRFLIRLLASAHSRSAP